MGAMKTISVTLIGAALALSACGGDDPGAGDRAAGAGGMRDAALDFARCMREQGIDFPDPEFPEEGGARVRIGPGTGIDPSSPKFQRAQKACAKELKGGPFGGPQREESP